MNKALFIEGSNPSPYSPDAGRLDEIAFYMRAHPEYEVVSVANATEAINYLDQHSDVDVVITPDETLEYGHSEVASSEGTQLFLGNNSSVPTVIVQTIDPTHLAPDERADHQSVMSGRLSEAPTVSIKSSELSAGDAISTALHRLIPSSKDGMTSDFSTASDNSSTEKPSSPAQDPTYETCEPRM